MTAKEWLNVIQQAADYPQHLTPLIEKYGEILLGEQQEDKVIEEVKDYMDDLDSYFQEDKISDDDLPEFLTEVKYERGKFIKIASDDWWLDIGVKRVVFEDILIMYDQMFERLKKGSEDKIGKAIWEEKLYNQLNHICGQYSDEWDFYDHARTSDLLHDYQTRNIP